MRKTLTFTLLLCCLRISFLTAQTPHFQQYYPLKKSTSFEVYKLFQDSHGYMWFGTNHGLFRFDGTEYRQYTVADSLPDTHVTALAEDSLGRLWLGFRSGHLGYFERNIFHPFETREGPAAAAVSDILFTRDGVLWFATLDDGLYFYVSERLYRVDEQEGLPNLYVYDLFEDAEGNVWAGTDGGIAICTRNDRAVSIRVLDHDDGLTDLIVKKISPINDDTLGLATDDEGILKYCWATGQIKPLIREGWDHGTINDFVVKENQVWISVPRRGLIVFDRALDRFKRYDEPAVAFSNTLLQDREGNIWIGTRSGLSRTIGDAIELVGNLGPSADINVLAVAIDHDDRIWFSTRDGLFQRTLHDDGTAGVVQKLTRSKFRDATVISLYTDDYGYVWAGMYGAGLLRIDPVTDEVVHFGDELRNGNILDIAGRGDTLVVATLAGASFILGNDAGYRVQNYGSGDGLSSDFIYQVLLDSRGRTWFATDGKGVSMLDEQGFHHFEDGFGSTVIFSLAEDSQGNLWAVAQDNGIYRFDGKGFLPVPEVRLRDNSVQALIADLEGNVIAVHDYGIDVFNIDAGQMRYWGEEAGVRDMKPNLNAVTADRHGRFYVGTSRGIIKCSLSNDHLLARPKPAIESFSVYNEAIDLSGLRPLAHDENNITIRYIGFWYQNAANVYYQYKLENYDVDWIVTADREVTYSRLPPGKYTFRVQASDNEDFSGAAEATLTFTIRPPFWTTAPFYFLTIAVFIIAGYGYIKWRERSLQEAKLILEARVEERTREIQVKNEEIQAQNEEILAQAEEIQGINENLEMLVKQRTAELERKNKALEEYAFINAHKLRGPVASILGLLNLLAKSDGKDPKLLEHLQQSAEKLDDVVRSITKAIERADNKYL